MTATAAAVVIKNGYFEGGRGLATSTARHKRLENVLRAIAADTLAARVDEIVSADAIDLATALTLVNEIKAALNLRNNNPTAPLLAAGAGTYDLSGAGAYVLTVNIDGVARVFTFQGTDFVDDTAVTAAELAGALNQRGDFAAAGVVAQDNAGTLELVGKLGGDHSLQGVAGGANAVLALSATTVNGTGFVPKLTAIED